MVDYGEGDSLKIFDFIGKYAARTAPAKNPKGGLDFSYSNIDIFTGKPGRYMKYLLRIDRIESGRIIATRISLLRDERRQEIIEGEQWFDDAWANVNFDGRVDDR
jgi:hypothetical protein